jgi:dolichol-phosphate mannosyltransferase
LSDEHFILDMAEFCLLTAEVRDAIVQDNNTFPFIRASIGRIGYRIKNIPYKRQKRIAGRTHYNFMRMTIFAVSGILSSSTLWLRLPTYIFPFWSVGLTALCTLGYAYDWKWYLPAALVMGFVYCGFTLAGIGIYVARTYKNGLNRPNYVIDRKKSQFQPPAPIRAGSA